VQPALKRKCLSSSYDSVVYQLLSCISTLTRGIDIEILSVCLSVRHVPVFCRNDLTNGHSFFTTR